MRPAEVAFALIWSRWVMPLRGKTISGLNGLTNRVVEVSWDGVVRVSRNELVGRIPLEPFDWAVRSILQRGAVTRKAINAKFPHRYSSAVQLVLEQVPIFEAVGRPAVIRLRADWKERLA